MPDSDLSELEFYIPLTEVGFMMLCDYSKPDSFVHSYHSDVLAKKYVIDSNKL